MLSRYVHLDINYKYDFCDTLVENILIFYTKLSYILLKYDLF